MARQLTFDLPVRAALGREDFFVSPANAAAVASVEEWRAWPARKMLLTGPEGSGKTHLVHVWAGLAEARIVPALELGGADIPALAAGPVAVEDADRVAGEAAAEAALFHLHNLVLAEGHALLLTAEYPAGRWGLTLPDLKSRMQGTATATLQPPDDTLLAAVLVKLFTDRQLSVDPKVIDWLTRHMDRSFAAAGALVDALDATALAERRAITQPFAARVLDKLRRDTA